MNALFSPGSLVTVLGASLTVVGSIAYATDSPNLSLAGVFYGVPVLLGGLALKSSELPPARRLTPPGALKALRQTQPADALPKLLGDVTRWRYGQKAHLESSLEALKLWDDDDPPQLESVEEIDHGGYGLRLRFRLGAVPYSRWVERQERLGRFFGKGLRADLRELGGSRMELDLVPATAAAAEPQPETAPS
ncbi:DUF2854 domain-containing protein [Synechococcus sp. RSCCF101]|uniref:DUF2854 domain-containing protein n=1 Tax=Synechococcus sp. RSCCF101 TaxID=2511069 RepID=UPI0012471593|nr:DUF2854 domain-containing protein [Synechococcus sp. RSCCF101]QEY33324.1 DUF2854 domain-containing protein [Synechococcus sp. RSCCF101]